MNIGSFYYIPVETPNVSPLVVWISATVISLALLIPIVEKILEKRKIRLLNKVFLYLFVSVTLFFFYSGAYKLMTLFIQSRL